MLASGVVDRCSLVLAVAGATAAPPSVTATDLGTLGGNRSFASAVNDNGQVVGNSQITVGAGQSHAFIWTQAGGTGGCYPASGVGTNPLQSATAARSSAAPSRRRVASTTRSRGRRQAGWSTSALCRHHAATSDSASVLTLPREQQWASGRLELRRSGRLVPFMERAFSWTQAGGIVDLGTLGGPRSKARRERQRPSRRLSARPARLPRRNHAFSSGRRRAGWSTSAPSAVRRAFALAINNSGQVVGWSNTRRGQRQHTHSRGRRRVGWSTSAPSAAAGASRDCGERRGAGGRLQHIAGNSTGHAFLWTQAGGMVDLGTLGGDDSQAKAVNDAGQVVGEAEYSPGNNASRAFSWTQASGLVDLGTFGGSTSRALAVNNDGLIVGESDSPDGPFDVRRPHAALWVVGPSGPVDTDGDGVPDSLDVEVASPPDSVGFSDASGTRPRKWHLWSDHAERPHAGRGGRRCRRTSSSAVRITASGHRRRTDSVARAD